MSYQRIAGPLCVCPAPDKSPSAHQAHAWVASKGSQLPRCCLRADRYRRIFHFATRLRLLVWFRVAKETNTRTDADRRALQVYLDCSLDDLMEELSLYDPTARGTADVWQKIAGPLHQRLCVEWDYCQIRKTARFENDIDLAVAVLTTLTTQALALPIAA